MGNMASTLFGNGTAQGRYEVSSPQSTLEHITDFFTCGSVRKERAEKYDFFVDSFALALEEASPSKYCWRIPARLRFDFSGYSVLIRLSQKTPSHAEPVYIELSKDGNSIESDIDRNIFCRICTVLLVRGRFNLPVLSITLTNEGYMNLRGVKLNHCDLVGIDLSKADLSNADLSEARLEGADLRNAVLKNADLSGANLKNADLGHANLGGATLKNADLSGANLKEVNMANACMAHADLTEADLNEADMSWADLGAAVLNKAKLTKAVMYDANLDNAILTGADLTGAKLDRAYMGKADLKGAILNGTQVGSLKHSVAQFRYPHRNAASLKEYTSIYAIFDISGVQQDLKNTYAQQTMIDSIDDQYADVKKRLSNELTNTLEDIDVSSAALPLRDFLSKDPFANEVDIPHRVNNIPSENLKDDIHQPEFENPEMSRLNEAALKKGV